MSFATVVMSGNLVKDVQVFPGQNRPYATTRIAINRGKDKTDFYSVVAFGKTADFLAFGQSGSRVTISGDLELEHYEHQGQQRTEGKVLVNRVDVHTKRRELEDAPAGGGDSQFDSSKYTS